MTKKRRRPESVLRRQRASARGKPPPLGQRLLRYGKVAGIVVALAAIAYGAVWIKRRADALAAGPDSLAWRVSLKLDGDTPLTDKQQDDIIRTARHLLGKGSRRELAQAAQAIQQLDAYADVHILRLATDSVAVQVHQRVPVLCIDADRIRFVASTGEVYGQADKDHCPGPVLTGVFDAGVHVQVRSDYTVALSTDERTLVHEGVDLLKLAKDSGFTLAAMSVQRYRGFTITLAGSGTEVAIGRAPFAPKLSKLQGILDKYAERREQVARVELDYQGKAFIKLKKM